MASTYLSRASGTPTSTRKFTISFWVKKCGQGADQFLVSSFTDSNNRMQVNFNTDDRVDFISKVSGTNIIRKQPTRQLRDPSAFYHILVAVDTTLATASDRCKLYINGSQESVFTFETNPSQNADANVSGDHFIGAYDNGGSPALFFDGLMTHIHYTDGYTYQASDFGESDSVSGIWKPKTAPSVTYGTNGFFLKMENSGAMGTDSSGNSNTFTVSGNLTQNVDTASNNFATLNPLFSGTNDATLSNGNLSYTNTNLTWRTALTTLGVTTGKWYFEFKNTANDAGSALRGHLGCVREDDAEETSTEWISDSTTNGTNVGWDWNSGTVRKNAVTQYTGNTVSAGDICSIALDLDNGYIYFGKNNIWENSGDPTSGASGTGGTSLSTSTGKYWFVGYSSYNSCASSANFGQGYFGTTAVVSANADANGQGAMEYAVPTGYYTLNTKNIKEFG